MTDTYQIFVDSSGCDGFKISNPPKPNESSLMIVTSVLVVPSQDLDYDDKLMVDVKKAAGMKDVAQEIKYERLRLGINKQKALETLGRFAGQIFLFIVDKREVDSPQLRDPKTKLLYSVAHAWPLFIVLKILPPDCLRSIRVTVDKHKKKAYEDASIELLSKLLEDDNSSKTTHFNKVDPGVVKGKIHFVDSRDVNLVQAADLVAGAAREAFECYAQSNHRLPCKACRGTEHHLCRHLNKASIRSSMWTMQHVWPLIPEDHSQEVNFYGVTVFPFKLGKSLRYLDCNRGPRLRKK